MLCPLTPRRQWLRGLDLNQRPLGYELALDSHKPPSPWINTSSLRECSFEPSGGRPQSLEVHEACVEPLVGGCELRQHGGAMRAESNAFDTDTREEAEAGQVKAPEADDHRERARGPHRDTRIARARVAISVSPMAPNACAAPSMPSCERSLRA